MVNLLLQYEELVIQVVKSMKDDVLEVAKIAGNTLVNIGKHSRLANLKKNSHLCSLR